MNNFTTKYILKKYAKQILPKEIIHRYKNGFSIPLSFWIRNELKDYTLDVLSEKKIKREGIFRYAHIKRLLNEHFAERADNQRQIWALLMFELRLRKYSHTDFERKEVFNM